MKSSFKVGLFILLSGLSCLLILFFLKDLPVFNQKGKNYIITFKYMEELKNRAPILVNGSVRVGNAVSIKGDGELAYVYIKITDPVINKKLQKDRVSFQINANNPFSQKYILLSFNKPNSQRIEFPKDNSIPQIAGVETPTLHTSLSKVNKIANNVNHLLEKEIQQILSIIADSDLKKTLKNIHHSSVKLNKILTDIQNLSGKFEENHFDPIMYNLNKVILNLNVTTDNIQQVILTTYNIVNKLDKTIATNQIKVDHTMDELKKFATALNDKQTPIGMLAHDKKLGKDLKKGIQHIIEIIKGVNEIFKSKNKENHF